jgi:hypothetical protein
MSIDVIDRIGWLAWGTAAIAIAFVARSDVAGMVAFYHDTLTRAGFGLAMLGWIVATYGPMTLAVLFWRSARMRSHRSARLMFLPCVIAVAAVGEAMLYVATGGFAELGPDLVLRPAWLLLVLIVAAYPVATMAPAMLRRLRRG